MEPYLTFEEFVAKLQFWDKDTPLWTHPDDSRNRIDWSQKLDPDFKTWVIESLRPIYEHSDTAKKMLSDWAKTHSINIVKSKDATGPGFVVGSGDNVTLALNEASTGRLCYFNEKGTYVQDQPGLTIVHELIHLIEDKPDLISPLDGSRINIDTITDDVQNLANFDDKGATVTKQNTIAREVGVHVPAFLNNIQAAYLGTRYGPWQAGKNYTGGRVINVARHGDKVQGTLDNWIMPADRDTVPSNDLYFGLGGIDTIKAGAGEDNLFGGAGDDHLFGEDGEDRLFGGGDNDELDGGRGNDFIQGGTSRRYMELDGSFTAADGVTSRSLTDGGLHQFRGHNTELPK